MNKKLSFIFIILSIILFHAFVFPQQVQRLFQENDNKIFITSFKNESGNTEYDYLSNALPRSIAITFNKTYQTDFSETLPSPELLRQQKYNFLIKGTYSSEEGNLKVSFSIRNLKRNLVIVSAEAEGPSQGRQIFTLIDRMANILVMITIPSDALTRTMKIKIDRNGKITTSLGDFVGTDLRGRDFSNQDLSNKNFIGANLEGANFTNANLTNTNFTRTNLLNTTFKGSIIHGTKFNLSSALNIDFSKAKITNADFSGASLNGSNFSRNSVSGSNFERADLTDANFNKSNLKNTNLRLTLLKNANLVEANLSALDLSETDLTNAKLDRSILAKIKIKGKNLDGLNLTGADLSGASLTYCSLKKVNFINANLTATNFTESDLTDAIISNTNLNETNFEKAKLVRISFISSKLNQVNFLDADASYGNFSKANLIKVNFKRTNLQYAIFTETIFTETSLKEALNYGNIEKFNLFGFGVNVSIGIHNSSFMEYTTGASTKIKPGFSITFDALVVGTGNVGFYGSLALDIIKFNETGIDTITLTPYDSEISIFQLSCALGVGFKFSSFYLYLAPFISLPFISEPAKVSDSERSLNFGGSAGFGLIANVNDKYALLFGIDFKLYALTQVKNAETKKRLMLISFHFGIMFK